MKDTFRMLIVIGGGYIILPIIILWLNHIPIGSTVVEMQQEITLDAPKEKQDIIEESILIGILAKEIPYTYELEALKAQAVVNRTYMARRILGLEEKGTIVGYTDEEMRTLWGQDYDRIYHIYKEAVEQTKNRVILYNHKPVEAIYHEASSGRTRNSEDVYPTIKVPYLRGVASEQDTIRKQIQLPKLEIVKKLQAIYPNFAGDAEQLQDQIQVVQRDQAGYIILLQVSNITIKGEEFQQLLGLPSCAFSMYDSDKDIIFDIKGIGNGIGLSQNGANELAKQGKSYQDILKHYYTGVTVELYDYQK